ncbi:dsRBD fold-containing protein [Intrasporangium flavum]|uniref:dsRBD fold-containing protein n=1 Tax=Intrasporangium flavum TaxID=1428657 RepID=UPI00096D228D|nr:dsRBD fold-containing protein [Intrasporangium flavum]
MKANEGDRIVLAPVTVDAPVRDGEVLETRGPGGTPPFLIRWSDGHTGLFYPGPGAVLSVGAEHAEQPEQPERPEPVAGPAPTAAGASAERTEPTRRPRVHDWHVRVTIFESDDETHANVVLLSDSPAHLTARGESTRGTHDQPVPEIGDEIAVARALRHLADQLIAVAEGDIETLTGEHDVRVRAT